MAEIGLYLKIKLINKNSLEPPEIFRLSAHHRDKAGRYKTGRGSDQNKRVLIVYHFLCGLPAAENFKVKFTLLISFQHQR